MRIVTPICIFFVRRAVRSPLCVTLPLYHSKVLYSFYLHFMHTLRQSSGRKLRSFVAWRVSETSAGHRRCRRGGKTMNDNELKFDRSCHVLYSKPCKREIRGKIALRYPEPERGAGYR